MASRNYKPGEDAIVPVPDSPLDGIDLKVFSQVDVEKGLNIVQMKSIQNESLTPSTEKREEPPPAQLPSARVLPWTLYRYAHCSDVLLILLGTVCAIVGGLAQPFHVLIFGKVVDQFVYFNVTRNLTRLGSSSDYFCNGTFVDTTLLRDYLTSNSKGTLLQDNIEIYSYYYVGVATAAMLAVYVSNVVWNASAYRQTRRMRIAFYNSVLRQEVGWFDMIKNTARLNNLLQDDTEKIQSGIGDKASLFLQYMTTFLAGYVIAFVKSWKLSLVLASVAPLLVGASIATVKFATCLTAREQKAYSFAGAVAEEVLSSIRTVVAFGGEEKEANRYNRGLKKARKAGLLKGLLVSLIEAFTFFVVFGLYPLGFWYGSKLFLDCEVSAGDVVTVFFAVVYGSVAFGYSLSELSTFGVASASARHVFGVIDKMSAIDPASGAGERPESLAGNIEFSNVVFSYPSRPDVQVLHGLDLKIKAGQTVALVGPSGCGKSTTVQLIQRFYDPSGGQVTIDGRNVKELNLRWLRDNIGVVSQEPVLFDTTIAENICYGKLDASTEEIEQAAKKASAYKFISELPDKFETMVGERAQLSGGQKQRIAIARALVRNPKILLLDEATSALDNESEKVVQEALDKAREGRTTIIIAHRLSTIQNADVIVYLEQGLVVEAGTHVELMLRRGKYYDMATTVPDAPEPMADFMADVKQSVRTYSVSRRLPSVSTNSITASLRRSSLKGPPPLPPKGMGSVFELRESPYSSIRRSIGAYYHKEEKEEEVDYYNVAEWHEEQKEVVPDVSLKELIKYNAPDWIFILIGIVFSTVNGAIFPVIAVPSSQIVKVYGESSKDTIDSTVSMVCLEFLGLAIAAFLATFFGNFSLSVAGERLTKRLRLKSFQSMLRQNMGWYDVNSTGVLSTRLAVDASEVKGVTAIRFGVLSKLVSSIVTALVIGLVASWQLALLMMICFATVAVSSFLQLKLIQGRSNKNKELLENSAKTASEAFRNSRTVIGLGLGDRFCQTYNEKLDSPFRENMINVISLSIVLGLAQGMIYYLFAAGIRLGSFLVAGNYIQYDNVFRVFQAVVFTALAIGRALSAAPDTAKARASAARIHTLLQLMPPYLETGHNMEKTDGAVTFTNVSFKYPTRPEVPVLCGLNIAVTPGKALALVGPSGCGKSTVVSLIERFYDLTNPTDGNITLNGKDIKELNISWLRKQIGLVSQEPVLFNTSIADNIRYGDNSREVPMEEVIEAAKAANIHIDIEKLPQSYDTNVGDGGRTMSGGQKQRIAIARALVRNPKILLLDEATSALDNESEKVVQEALDKAREGRTTIIIAHRLSTIQNADSIAVIYKGKVLEQGTHEELMAKKGAYYDYHHIEKTEEAITDI